MAYSRAVGYSDVYMYLCTNGDYTCMGCLRQALRTNGTAWNWFSPSREDALNHLMFHAAEGDEFDWYAIDRLVSEFYDEDHARAFGDEPEIRTCSICYEGYQDLYPQLNPAVCGPCFWRNKE